MRIVWETHSMVTLTFRHLGSGRTSIINHVAQKRHRKVKWVPVPHNRGPSAHKSRLQVWFGLLLVTVPPLENNSCCSSAFEHVNSLEQGKLGDFIHLSSRDKFKFRCPGLKMKRQAVALSLSKSGSWGAIQRETAFISPTHSLPLPQILQSIWTGGTLVNCLLLACYKMKHVEETKPPYSHFQWAAGVSVKIEDPGPRLPIFESQDEIFHHWESHIIITILHPGRPCQFLKWSVRNLESI